ncbi:MAG: hypothetical protein HDQ87_04970 [Clostridia bacterium]|nr:hypothetical protein [Clostridia bacterium]
MDGIKITLFLLIAIRVLPFVVTQLLISEYPFQGRKKGSTLKWAVTIANILLNGLVLYWTIVYSKFDLVEILNFECTYQDIARLAFSDIVSIAVSVLVGIGLRTIVGMHYHDKGPLRFSGKPVLCILIAAIPIMLGYYYSYSGASNFSIVEVCRKTTGVDTAEYPLDEDALGDKVSYVTVINNGVLSYEMGPMYLSDNADNLKEREITQNLEIKPGAISRLYMSNEDAVDIKKSGGSIVYLSNEYGNVVDRVEVPALKENEIYKNSETGWQIEESGDMNETVVVPAPSFSQEGGFYDDAFELELTASPGTTIYYTLDCSNPTTESTEYSGPIHVYDRSAEENQYSEYVGEEPVDKCFVVRAAAVDSDGNFSDTITKSYFINQKKHQDRAVISLVSDPDGLFGDDGIYVAGKEYEDWYSDAVAKAGEDGEVDTSDAPTPNYEQRGIEWEIESNLEVFKDTYIRLNQPVGIRIQGNAYRKARLKRFSIYARDEYSSSDYFDVNLINDYKLHSTVLRVGQEGNLHAICQMLGKDRDVATADFILADVFLDGEFWYTTYVSEKFNERNFAEKYGLLSKDNVVIYKAWGDLDEDSLEAGKNALSDLNSFIRENDLSQDENYLKCNEILDVQSYIDWLCFNTFLQNQDYSETANTISWHTIVPENDQEGDTRWRFGLYDMDLGWKGTSGEFDGISAYEINPFDLDKTSAATKWPIYLALKDNELFRKQFVLTFMDLVNTNLSLENAMAVMEELGIEDPNYEDFFEHRPAYVVPHLAEEFELTGTQETVTLSANVPGTPITLNTISPELRPSADAFAWTGNYFTDYSVTVTPNAPNFSHWEITASGDTQTFTDGTIEVPIPEGGVQIHAVYEQ